MLGLGFILPPDQAGRVMLVGVLYAILLVLGVWAAWQLGWRLLSNPAAWHTAVERLRARPWNGPRAGAVLLILLTTQGLFLLVGRKLAPAGGPEAGAPGLHLLVMESLVVHLGGLFLLGMLLRRLRLGWSAAFGMERNGLVRRLGGGSLAYLASLPMVFAAALVYQAILLAHGHEPALQDVARLMASTQNLWFRLYMFFLAAFLAPLFEECVFRGVLLPALARGLGTGPAVFLTSALFAALHFHLPAFAPLATVAVVFSLAYVYTGSLWVPVAMHGLFNGVNLLFLFLVGPLP